MQSESTLTVTDDEHYGSGHYDTAIPIVQRENSSTRLQEIFSDHITSNGPRPVTEVSLPPPGTSSADSPVEVRPPPPPPPPQGPPLAEMRNMYSPQQPILVQNSTPDSEEGDIIHRSRSQQSSRDRRAPLRQQSEMRRVRFQFLSPLQLISSGVKGAEQRQVAERRGDELSAMRRCGRKRAQRQAGHLLRYSGRCTGHIRRFAWQRAHQVIANVMFSCKCLSSTQGGRFQWKISTKATTTCHY